MCSDRDSDDSRPATPAEEDCCHNACDPCIFDMHKKLLEEYESKKKRKQKVKTRKNILHPSSYRSFTISSIKEASENYILLTLEYSEDGRKGDTALLMDPGQYIMLHSSKMTRPYTPISWSGKSIDFLVKIYPDGVFSSYLKTVKVGDRMDVRGPYGDFKYERNSFQQIVMFSIGSGIAAVYPIAKMITDDEFEDTRVHLVGGFRKMSEVPLKKELQILSDFWNFSCTLHISQQFGDFHDLHGVNVKNGRLDKNSLSEALRGEVEETLILICGTEHFNRSIEEWTRDLNYKHVYVFK